MRTVTYTETLYQFSELDESAKDRARDDYAECGSPWGAEVNDSLKACVRWINWSEPAEILEMPYGPDADCIWTGYCADADLSDAVVDAVRGGETDREVLRQVAQETADLHAERDMESMLTDEAMAESAEANGWEYHKNGKLA